MVCVELVEVPEIIELALHLANQVGGSSKDLAGIPSRTTVPVTVRRTSSG